MWPYTDEEADWLAAPETAPEAELTPVFDEFEAFALWNGA